MKPLAILALVLLVVAFLAVGIGAVRITPRETEAVSRAV